jgi:hypothetical protein
MKTQHRKAARAKRTGRIDFCASLKAITRTSPFTPDEAARLALPGRMALEAMRTGRGVDDNFHTLAEVINTTMVACEPISDLLVSKSQMGAASLICVLERRNRIKRWGFTAQELQAVADTLDIYDSLLEHLTPQQMMDALHEVLRRNGAGNRHGEPIHGDLQA